MIFKATKTTTHKYPNEKKNTYPTLTRQKIHLGCVHPRSCESIPLSHGIAARNFNALSCSRGEISRVAGGARRRRRNDDDDDEGEKKKGARRKNVKNNARSSRGNNGTQRVQCGTMPQKPKLLRNGRMDPFGSALKHT